MRALQRTGPSVLALATLACAVACSGSLGAGFANADQQGVVTLRKAQVGETLWFGLPVMAVRLKTPIEITGAHLDDRLPVAGVQFFNMQLFGPNEARHVTVLPDSEFRGDHFTVGPALIGTMFRPGNPTHYGLMRLAFTQAGDFTVRAVTLAYRTESGRSGTQVIRSTYEVHVQ